MAYSDDDKAGALAVLASCGGNVNQAARRLGIPEKTLRVWKNGGTIKPGTNEKVEQKKRSLADLFEAEAVNALEAAGLVRDDASYAQLMTGAAIAIDKMRLLREQSTGISEQSVTVNFENASTDQLRALAWGGDDDTDPAAGTE